MPRYDFKGGMAGNAIQEFLMQRALEERQAQMDEFARRRQADDDEDRKREIGLREREFGARQARQERLDAQAEEDRQRAGRQETNEVGVRDMIATKLGEGPLDQSTAQQISAMGYREGVGVPGVIDQALKPPNRTTVRTRDDKGNPIQRAVTDDELVAGVPEYQEPDAPASGGSWASAGNGTLYNTKTGETKPIGSGSGSGGDASHEYASETADRTISAIDAVLPKINNWTAGAGGALLSKFPGTDASNVNAELQTVAGNIAFNALQQMRNASKTGGALGSVAQQELQLLQSVEGSLRQDQSPANLKAQLTKVRESMERFKTAQALGGSLNMGRTGGGGGGAVKWGRDANGKPVRLQ